MSPRKGRLPPFTSAPGKKTESPPTETTILEPIAADAPPAPRRSAASNLTRGLAH